MSLFLQLPIQIYADEMRSKTGLKITLGVGGTVEDINETGCCGLVIIYGFLKVITLLHSQLSHV